MAAIVAVCVALGFAYGTLRVRYNAAAAIEVSSGVPPPQDRKYSVVLSLTDMKRFWASYANAPALRSYLDLSKSDPGDLDRFLRAAGSDTYWKQWVRPLYPIGRADVREFGDMKQLEREQATQLLGVDLRIDGPSDDVAARKVITLRDYLIDALVDNHMKDWVLSGRLQYESRRAELEARLIEANRRLSEMQIRLADLNGILKRYPESARIDRQVVSVNVNDGSDRFLSPVAQIVAVESSMSSQRNHIRDLEREAFQSALYKDFYDRAAALYERPMLAPDRLKSMDSARAEILPGARGSDSRVREVHSVIQASLQAYGALLHRLSMQAAPWVSRDQMRSPLGGTLIGLVLGLGIVALWTLIYRAFSHPANSTV